MAKQTINIGTAGNDGTGNTLRAAMDMCNDNFTELYDLKVRVIDSGGDITHISAINTATGLTPATAVGIIFIEANAGSLVYSTGVAWFSTIGNQIVLA